MRQFLAFDIGGTLLKYGVLKEDGSIIEKRECPSEAHLGGPSMIEKVKKLGRPLLDHYNIEGICVSTAGQVDSVKGNIIYASPLIPDYTGFPLKKELESFFSLPVEIENDVNCAGLAESWIGTGKNVKSLFCLTIGTGIGGSFILDNKLHSGHNFSAGEIGYIPIESGQFEDLASTKTLIQNVAYEKGISKHDITGKEIFELAKKGDSICIQEISKQVSHLSKGIATIAYMMNPEMIVIGGGITAQKDYLYPLLMDQLKRDIIPAVLDNTKIEIAQNLNNAGMIGALRHFLLQESIQPLKSITAIIESNNHKLTKREQLVADYVIHNLASVSNTTISQLAENINVSDATITRFCKKLEFGSYNKLRLMAKEAFVSTRLYEHTETSSITKVKQNYNKLLNKFDALIQANEIQKFKDKITRAKNVYLYGSNNLSTVVDALKYKFLNKGIRAEAFSNQYHMNMSANFINEDSCVIGISLSGYSRKIVDILEKAKSNGAKTIGVTSQQDSPVSDISELLFVVPSNENEYSGINNVNEVSVLYLFDIIFEELEKQVMNV
ncbi:ROK family protein [Virgibacillus dakarensis]|uniref:ROK family protein n=1 Tax=Virgibacillus dakarensis TaxID=1917889 RepID=UPI000B44D3CA|nr:ROK family protein [Virgibacillus dakarensis]MBT2216323.1 ROK family protein [Virgibacillus dakarensis]MTW85172.1 ROK family protein [Virgibacillus dakarensis]